MQEELIEEVDWNDNVLKIRPKRELKQERFLHRGVVIIPKSEDNKFILCRRAKHKFPFPDVWCCAIGGHVRLNEAYEQAALREMKEEIGIETELIKVAKVKYNGEKEKVIHEVYTTKDNLDINSLNCDPEEIQFLKSFTIKEISEMIQQNPKNFIPTFLTIFEEFKRALEIFT